MNESQDALHFGWRDDGHEHGRFIGAELRRVFDAVQRIVAQPEAVRPASVGPALARVEARPRARLRGPRIARAQAYVGRVSCGPGHARRACPACTASVTRVLRCACAP